MIIYSSRVYNFFWNILPRLGICSVFESISRLKTGIRETCLGNIYMNCMRQRRRILYQSYHIGEHLLAKSVAWQTCAENIIYTIFISARSSLTSFLINKKFNLKKQGCKGSSFFFCKRKCCIIPVNYSFRLCECENLVIDNCLPIFHCRCVNFAHLL